MIDRGDNSLIIASDIHIREGSELFRADIEKALSEDDDHVLVISGDVTQSAKKEEYARVASWFKGLSAAGIKIVLTAGNHDITKRLHIISFVMEKYKARFGELIDVIEKQSNIIAKRDCCDIIYKIDKDIFCSLRSTHARHWKSTRIAKKQYKWAEKVLTAKNLTVSDGYRLHLVTHHSLWQSSGNDKHFHMHKKRRLVEDFLKPLGFSTAINGHNHRFDSGHKELKGYYLYHIQAPTLSTKTKGGRFVPGFVKWSPGENVSVEIIEIVNPSV